MKKIGLFSIILVIIDQLLKQIISRTLSLYDKIEVIPNFFSITYTKNDGGAWSILSGNRILFIAVALLCLIFIYEYFLKGKTFSCFEIVMYSLLIGGILGNLMDRIFYGYVIDYLSFIIFSYPFPVFNLADTCIVIGVILLIYEILRGEKYGKI